MNVKSLAFIAVLCLPSVVAADPVGGKLCLFAAAAKLPTVPGLKVTRSSVGEPQNSIAPGSQVTTGLYRGEIDVEAFSQKATYSVECEVLSIGAKRQLHSSSVTLTR